MASSKEPSHSGSSGDREEGVQGEQDLRAMRNEGGHGDIGDKELRSDKSVDHDDLAKEEEEEDTETDAVTLGNDNGHGQEHIRLGSKSQTWEL